MKKIREIFRLYSTTDLSIRKIARAVSISRPVIKAYLDSFDNSGLTYDEIISLNDDDMTAIIKSPDKSKNERYIRLSMKFEYYAHIPVYSATQSGIILPPFFHLNFIVKY